MGRPKGRDPKLSLEKVVKVLPNYMKGHTYRLIDDFLAENPDTFTNQKPNEILVLENIRFYSDKVRSDPAFLEKLSKLGDVFVNDVFAMSHRDEPTVTGLPKKLPGYAGLLLIKEVSAIENILNNPKKPLVSIIGGAKIATKVESIKKLIDISDYVLVGGGIANTFLKAHGYEVGNSIIEKSEVSHAKEIIDLASLKPVSIGLPIDARIGHLNNPDEQMHVITIPEMSKNWAILDIGPKTAELYENIISQAKTVLWNGPMGMFEHEQFRHGTDSVYKAIVNNHSAYSLVGGGDTLAALARKRQKHSINHLCTGGGAMLHLIEHGDLVGLKALRR